MIPSFMAANIKGGMLTLWVPSRHTSVTRTVTNFGATAVGSYVYVTSACTSEIATSRRMRANAEIASAQRRTHKTEGMIHPAIACVAIHLPAAQLPLSQVLPYPAAKLAVLSLDSTPARMLRCC